MYAGDEVYPDEVTSGLEEPEEECQHDNVERDDDGLSGRWYVCRDCDRTVVPVRDEDGFGWWEVVE
jgi:hypothetical protein